MKAITQRESVVTYVKSCLIFKIPRFMLISKYHVISPLREKEQWYQTIYIKSDSCELTLMKSTPRLLAHYS